MTWVNEPFPADGAILEERIASTQQPKPHLDFEDVSAGIQIRSSKRWDVLILFSTVTVGTLVARLNA